MSEETLEEVIIRLDPTVKLCIKHGNPSCIEVTNEGEIILAAECGCFMSCRDFDSLDEAVAWWNDQPMLEELVNSRNDLKRRLDLLEEQAKALDALLVEAYAIATAVKYAFFRRTTENLERDDLLRAEHVQKEVEKLRKMREVLNGKSEGKEEIE